jgi:hypothetical protein
MLRLPLLFCIFSVKCGARFFCFMLNGSLEWCYDSDLIMSTKRKLKFLSPETIYLLFHIFSVSEYIKCRVRFLLSC